MKKFFSYIFKYNDDSYYVGCLGSVLQKRNLIDYISQQAQNKLCRIDKAILRYTALRTALRTNGDRGLITLISIFNQIQDKLFRIGRTIEQTA